MSSVFKLFFSCRCWWMPGYPRDMPRRKLYQYSGLFWMQMPCWSQAEWNYSEMWRWVSLLWETCLIVDFNARKTWLHLKFWRLLVTIKILYLLWKHRFNPRVVLYLCITALVGLIWKESMSICIFFVISVVLQWEWE